MATSPAPLGGPAVAEPVTEPAPPRAAPATLLRPESIGGLFVVTILAAWALADGGYPQTALYPGALALLGATAATALVWRGNGVRPSPLIVVAAALLAGFVAWGYASIIWAEVPGDAWEGANRGAVYLLAFLAFALPAWRSSSAAAVLGVFSCAVALIGVVAVFRAAADADPALLFVDGRFAEPISYHNASAALFAIVAIVAIALASRPELGIPWRALLLGIAGSLVELTLLSQSRGAEIALAIAMVVLLVTGPGRMRIALTLAIAAVGILPAFPAVLDVYSTAGSGSGADIQAALDDAGLAILLSSGLLVGLGAGLAVIDRRWRPSGRVVRIARRTTAVAAALAVLVGGGFAVAAMGEPTAWVEDRWSEFKSGSEDPGESGVRYGFAGRGRYDYWRVGLNEFREHPVIGVGTGGFATAYLRERRHSSVPRYTHSIGIQILAELGAIGALLIGGFVAAAGWAVVRARRSAPDGLGGILAAAALAVLAYALVHGSVDWLWQFPVVGAPVFALLGVAARLGHDPTPRRAESLGRLRSAVGPAAGSALALGLAASLLFPWIAARGVEVALAGWRADPEAAYRQLERALDLNPLSARPALAGGTIASLRGDTREMRNMFGQALEREPSSYALLQLGVLDLSEGRERSGLERLGEAQRLNPRDGLIASYLERYLAGADVSTARLNEELLGELCRRLGRIPATSYCASG